MARRKKRARPACAEPVTLPCPLCEREVPRRRMQRHHLQTRGKDRFDVELICADCHKSVHALCSNDELRDPRLELDTVEGLLANASFAKAAAFWRTVPPHRSPRMRSSRRRGARR